MLEYSRTNSVLKLTTLRYKSNLLGQPLFQRCPLIKLVNYLKITQHKQTI